MTEPAMTGFYVKDHGDNEDAPERFEVRFSFEGEVCFASQTIAEAAVQEYASILLASHSDQDLVDELVRRGWEGRLDRDGPFGPKRRSLVESWRRAEAREREGT